MTLQLDHVPDIDYQAHPAYMDLSAAGEDVNAQADALLAEIDSAYETALAADDPGAAFDRDVLPHVAALEALAKQQPAPPDFAPFLARALAIARATLRRNLSARGQTGSNSAGEELPAPLRDGLNAFHQDGFFETRTPGLARRIWRSTWIERAILRARGRREPHRHAALALHPASPAVCAIKQAAQDNRLESFIAAYLGKPVTLYYASLDYAHPGQRWFKGCYAAQGIDDSKTVYMHFDADTDIIKALFYLGDVTEKDGPFRFVRGSHRWNRSPFRMAVRKGFDEASTTTFPMTADRLDFERGYYRPRFQLSEFQKGMMALPRGLRGSTHFGDDVLNGSELSDALLRDEYIFVAPADTMVIFDGSRGIHRGSLTDADGQRWALQLAFKVCDGKTEGVEAGKPTLRARLSYLRQVAMYLLRFANGKA